MSDLKCDFCENDGDYLPQIGIGFGMMGRDFSFCEECLKNMSADEFWEKVFDEQDLMYPPIMKNKRDNYEPQF